MDQPIPTKTFANISQRAAASFRNLLARLPEPADEMSESQAELHAFFSDFYANLYQHPEFFGLPLGEDLSIAEDEPNAKDKKQEVKRRLDKPRALITGGLDYLMLAGVQGSLEGQTLRLKGHAAALKEAKASQKFLTGLESAGLIIAVANDNATLRSEPFPHMLAALQTLARCCATFEPAQTGRFQFSRCDFRALQHAGPEPTDLYRAFAGEEHALVMRLHEYFIDQKYKPACEVNTAFAWVVKYQGSRKVKATPLFQIDYDDRYTRPLRMQIKCASAQRIAELLPRQPQMLQDDFMRRAFPCRGDECGWCRNNKTLGPTVLQIQGDTRTVCWYSNPDIHELNPDTFTIIRQYEQLHAQLAS